MGNELCICILDRGILLVIGRVYISLILRLVDGKYLLVSLALGEF